VKRDKVVMGYWGAYVNIELRAFFIKHNDKWEMKEIYWK
jgi:hypothetical protein